MVVAREGSAVGTGILDLVGGFNFRDVLGKVWSWINDFDIKI